MSSQQALSTVTRHCVVHRTRLIVHHSLFRPLSTLDHIQYHLVLADCVILCRSEQSFVLTRFVPLSWCTCQTSLAQLHLSADCALQLRCHLPAILHQVAHHLTVHHSDWVGYCGRMCGHLNRFTPDSKGCLQQGVSSFTCKWSKWSVHHDQL